MLAPDRSRTSATTRHLPRATARHRTGGRRNARTTSALALVVFTAAAGVAAAASNDDALVRSLGGGTAGALGQPRLVVLGSAEVGKPFGLQLVDARPGSFAALATSAPSAPVPLPGTLATLHVGAPLASFTQFAIDAAGRSPVLYAAPSLAPALCGIEVHAQAVVLDPLAPAGLAFSAGKQVRLGLDDGGPLFEQRHYGSAGGAAAAVHLADMDGDGALDLLLASRGAPLGSGPDLAIRRGLPGGTFGDPLQLEVGTVPSDLAVADLDGDGRLDVVVANGFDDSLSVVLRTPSGGYAPPVELAVGFGPTAVVVADLDGDGVLDLAASVAGNALLPQRHVGVVRGLGGGAFAPVAFHEVGREPLALEAADLDGDGRTDLASASPVDGIGVLRATPGLGFEPVVYVAAGSAPSAVRAGDLDGDGRSDLVVANAGSGDVSVLRNLPSGFAPALHFPAAAGPDRLELADLDGDGLLDVAVAARDADRLVVLAGLGNGDLGPASATVVADEPRDLACADLDGDGLRDMVVTSTTNRSALVLLGRGAGTFLEPLALPSLGPAFVGGLDFAGDLDRDGLLDVVTLDTAVGAARVRLQQAGLFQTFGTVVVGTDVAGATLGDANADGILDLVVSHAGSATVSIHVGLGDGSFAGPFDVPTYADPASVALVDLDGDGLLDLAVGTDGPVVVPPRPGVTVHRASAPGVFGAPVHTFLAGQPRRGLDFRDVDGDGHLDVLMASNEIVGFAFGNGDGTFAEWPSAGLYAGFSGFVTGLATGDLDGDGHLDLVWGEFFDQNVFVYRGDGTDTFDWNRLSWFSAAAFGRPSDVDLGDVDGDGALDLVVAMVLEDEVLVYRGLGGGLLAAPQAYARGAGALLVRDFDGDDAPDLLLGGGPAPAALLRNQRYR
jgi:hypothetical protein